MKKWLKKVKNNEIIDILEDKSSKKKIYSVPKQVDEQVKFNLKKISEEIKSKKEKKNIFFIPKLAFGFSMIFIVIIGIYLYVFQSGSIIDSLRKKKLNQCLVTLIDGEVYLIDENYKNISELKVGINVDEKDIIKTGKDASLELQLGDDSLIRVKENSILQIVKLFKDNELEQTEIKLVLGKILAKPKDLTEGSSFEIKTKSVTAGVRGTEFTVVKTEEGVTKIAVNEGEVSVVKNIKSPEIKKIEKIDKELADNLNAIMQKEIVLKKDEKIELSDFEYNNYRDQLLEVINHISKDLQDNQEVKAELEGLIKTIKQKTIKELVEGADRFIIKEKVPQVEWRDDFNKEEFKEMGDVALLQEVPENKIEEKNVEVKKEEKKNEEKIKEKSEEKKEIIELPQIYKNDFEDNAKELFSTNERSKKEWGIILDDDNNHVFAPIQAEANSDAFIDIKETEDFILQFRFKRFPNKDKACWIAIDLGIDKENRFFNKKNDWIIPANDEIRFGNRLNERKYKTIKYNLEFNKWYNFKLIVESGKRFDIYIDNKLVLSYNKLNKDIVKYNYIKFEGHPTMGKWYLDDIYYEAK